jgi:thymidylate kinase
MSLVEYDILIKWFDFLTKTHDCSLDIVFYIRTSPQVCMERLIKRNRAEEVGFVEIDYLEKIHNLHEVWLVNKLEESTAKHVILIDGNKTLDLVLADIEMETKKLCF